ncbi:MAG: MFS transporter [Aeromicrobium sp.]|nr:MAG: MFS transporter [Aeromicrobium sp.]
MSVEAARLRRRYAIGGIATGTFGTVPGMLLMPYVTDVLAIGSALAGLIVFAPKAWDMILNPIAGRISDSVKGDDRRRPFLLVAGPLMGVGFFLMFVGPTQPPLMAASWVLVTFMLAATAYAFFQVPYLAMSAEITDDYDERSALMMWRVIVITIAIMIAGGGAPALVDLVGGARGYQLMGLVMGGLIVAGSLGVWWGTRNAPMTRTEESGGRLIEQFRIVLSNAHARPLVAGFVLQAVATTMLLAGVAYAARHVLGSGSYASVLFVAFMGPAVFASTWWARSAKRRGKRSGYLIASTFLAVGLVANTATLTGELLAAVIASVIIGIGYAGIQLFPLAMLPDIAAHDAQVSGQNRIGAYSGVWAGLELFGFALGPALFGLVLSLGGYVSGGGVQPHSAHIAIVLGMSAIPAGLVLVSMILIARYRLDDELKGASRPEESSSRP